MADANGAPSINVYDSVDLWNVAQAQPVVPSYWVDTMFSDPPTPDSNTHTRRDIMFDAEYILWDRLFQGRPMAPFVDSESDGESIYTRNGRVTLLKAPYIKLEDAIRPVDTRRGVPGKGGLPLFTGVPSQQARHDAAVADVMQTHINAIRRRLNWMCAQMAIYAQIVCEGDNYPRTRIQMGRNPALTVAKGPGLTWDQPGVSKIDDLNRWSLLMQQGQYGAAPTVATMSPDTWAVFRKDPEVLEQLNIFNRTLNVATLNIGYMDAADVQFVGQLSNNLKLYVTNEYVTVTANGQTVSQKIMGDGLIHLSNPAAAQGTVAWGGIDDFNAIAGGGFEQGSDIFPRNYINPRNGRSVVITQSAPLPVMVNPDATFLAKVL